MANGLAQAARGMEAPAEAPEEEDDGALAPPEELDSDIAFGMLASLAHSEQGSKVLVDALKSAKNPAPAIGMFLSGAVDKTAKKMEERGMSLSPRVWLAKGGAVDRAMDEIGQIAEWAGVDFNEQLQSMVYGEVIDQLKLAAQADKKGQQQQQGGAPAMGQAPEMGMGGSPPMQGGAPMQGPPPAMGGGMPMGTEYDMQP